MIDKEFAMRHFFHFSIFLFLIMACSVTKNLAISTPIAGDLLLSNPPLVTKIPQNTTSTIQPSTSPTIPPFSQIGKLDGHTAAINSLQWSGDGSLLASGSADGCWIIWDIQLQTSLLKVCTSCAIWGISWSPDGTQIATAGDGGAKIWNTDSGEKSLDLPGPVNMAYSIAWSPDGKSIAVGYAIGRVIVFDSQTGDVLQEWAGHIQGGISTEVIAITWSPEGKQLASGGLDYAIRLWEPITGSIGAVLRVDTPKRNDINGLAWSPDGRFLAAAGQDGILRIWHAQSGKLSIELGKPGSNWIRGVTWSPDGKYLATSGMDRAVQIWDSIRGTLTGTLTGHSSPVWSVAWSPDGKSIASGSGIYEQRGGDTSIRIWHVLIYK